MKTMTLGFSKTKGQEKSVVLNETAMKVLVFENPEETINREITHNTIAACTGLYSTEILLLSKVMG